MIREWIVLRRLGVPLRFRQLLGMALRKSLRRELVTALVAAHKAGLDLAPAELEAHYLAEGNVADVVKSALALKAQGVAYDRRKLYAVDLATSHAWDFTRAFLAAREREPRLSFGDEAIAFIRSHRHAPE
ncbi:MAG: flotillin-like FloA family protein [Gemmatimonadetes bacterium]|nr:flotillin-like FloA family protein [Gemmatimonadota bacterium]